jgi:hypothetical protein
VLTSGFGVSGRVLSDPPPSLEFMEMTRVLVDTADPCPGCGAGASVFLLVIDDEVLEESRECSHGCDELAAAIPAGVPARARRRKRVA